MVIQLKSGIQTDSLQVEDIAYAVTPTTIGSTQIANDPILVGVIEAIGVGTITITDPPNYTPLPDDFLMFSKDKQANNTSLLGYYAEVKLINDSTEEAELFALSSEVTSSSK